ncbi:MAG TPA: protein kinase [Gemmatimonadaceae bacterium]|nr:protein kinase [Gemmatimonadaceae bacterium]
MHPQPPDIGQAVDPLVPPRDARQRLLESTLGAQYEILRLLGQGGAGAVYLARERLLERLVAIKVLRPELVTAESRERFIREARTAAKLMHANIVPLYAFGQAGDTLFYIMGYVEGEPLESLLTRVGRLDSIEARRILVEVADALDYAHRQQVVHRDVKPDNILIARESRRTLLTDFGIAKTRSTQVTLTQTGHIVGTPLYMSPEQAAGDTSIDGRSDLYSLGVIGYRMLSGRLPIEGTSAQDVMRRHVMQDPTPLADIARDAPQDLAWSITRCLDKDPMRRWPTAEAFRRALEAGDDALSDLPEPLEHLAGRVSTVLVTASAFAFAAAVGWAVGVRFVPFAFAGALAIVAGMMVVPAYRHASAFGLDRRRTWKLLAAAPERWSGWWPRSLRRVGDAWQLLPSQVRAHRAARTLALATLLYLGPIALALTAGSLARAPRLFGPSAIVTAVLVAALAITLGVTRAAGVVALRTKGVAPAAFRRWLTEPTWGSKFWRRSEVAALLTPPTLPKPAIDSASEDPYCIVTPTQYELPHGMFDHIDPRSPTPLYAQIASRLRVAIASGELRSGEGLPSVRHLSGQLRVNPATVVQAYRELEVEGLVSTRQGAGTFVQDVASDRRDQERGQEARRLVRDMVAQAATFGITTTELRAAMEQELRTSAGVKR